jgi:RimJ/RimL family protein N-acetyltransferase
VKTIQTSRTQLHPLTPDDAAAIHELWSTPGVRRFIFDDKILPREEAAAIVERSSKLFSENGLGLWAARDGDDRLIGFTGYWYFRTPPELELLYGIAETHWGQGYAAEIASALVDYGFDELKLPEICASTDAANVASVRVLEKLGFRVTRREVIDGLDTMFFAVRLEERQEKISQRSSGH